MKLAVLTSGGDSAGMNAVVRAVVKAGILKGCETYVVREGYEGLVRGNTEGVFPAEIEKMPDLPIQESSSLNLIHNLRFGDGELLKDGTGDFPGGRTLKGRYIVRVGFDDVRGWFAEGGTLIGTARSKAFRTVEGRTEAAYNMIKEGIDALVICGGDGSLTGADVFRAEWPKLVAALLADSRITEEQAKTHAHLRIVGLVGSIDNDMSMTDLTIGAPTALHRICEAIDNINSTASSHSRAFVLEVMGRHCGWLALLAGVSGGADFIFIPERPPTEMPWEDELCRCIQRHREVGKRKTIVIVAEGAIDSNLNPIRADYVKDVLTDRLGLDTRVTTLGHTQRGGRPCAYDRVLPTLQGVEAVEALLEATPETPSYMIGIQENKITRVPLMEAVAMTRAVATAIEAKDFDKAMSLRDPEFRESLEGFIATSTLEQVKVPEEQRMRVAIMHMGAPAGGMNAATRAAVRWCIRRGHTPIAVHNGFRGLLDDNIHELSWLGVDSWMARGGSELGTNRTLPSVDLGAVASKFQEHSFHALMMIGGFEAFSSLLILEEGRKHYPAFHIPMVHLPATISNNVPVTEHSLGSDTSLNALVDACDAIKQSASASRNRVFVVETQGGKCGYIATLGALATGASLVYTPEQGIDLDTLRRDVRFLKTRYKLDVKGKSEGRLVIKNEASSQVYTTDVMTKMLKEEGGSLFDSRAAQLGHTLQGGVPSPIDRARAVRLSLKCMAFIERQHELLLKQHPKTRHATPDSAAVITIQASSVKWVPVQDMVNHADMQNRRGKKNWWDGLKDLAEALAGRPQLIGIHASDLAQLNAKSGEALVDNDDVAVLVLACFVECLVHASLTLATTARRMLFTPVMARAPLPLHCANPYVKSTLASGNLPPVKYQILNCQGQDILVGRLKIETPTNSGHAFILRRYDTGAVSLTTMFRAAFPNAPEQEEKDEVQWVKENYDLSGNNGSSKDTSITRLAGTWVSPDVALELGKSYLLGELIVSVVQAQPDPNANYRRSNKAAANNTASKPPTSTATSTTTEAPVKPPSTVLSTTGPNPPKRRKESSPVPPPSPARSPVPEKRVLPRRSTRTKSPAPTATLASAVKTPAKRSSRREPEVEVVTPGGSDETAVDEETEAVDDVAGEELRQQDLTEQKTLIEDLKAKRDAAMKTNDGVVDGSEQLTTKRAREEEDEQLKFNFKEPEIGERTIATNRRITGLLQEPRRQSLAWGVAAFVFGAGAVTLLPNFL